MDNIKPSKILRSPITEGRTSTDKANKIYNIFKTTATSEKINEDLFPVPALF